MKLRIDDIVHNEVTNEVGRIVRITKVNGRLGYVVVKANKPFGEEIEALWRPRELKEVRDRLRKWRAAFGRGVSENGDFARFPGTCDQAFGNSSLAERQSACRAS